MDSVWASVGLDEGEAEERVLVVWPGETGILDGRKDGVVDEVDLVEERESCRIGMGLCGIAMFDSCIK